MATLTGTQATFIDAVKDLLALECDAIEAYDAAINRLSNEEYINKMREFKSDHERHVRDFSSFLDKHGESYKAEPDVKQWLTKGKTVLAALIGDNAILRAMRSNEIDTNTAYDRIHDYEDMPEDAVALVNRALRDERRHKQWLEQTLGIDTGDDNNRNISNM